MIGKKKHKTPICKGCNRPLGKIRSKIQCSGDCKGWFHATDHCTSLTNEELTEVKNNKVLWYCETCNDSESDEESEVERLSFSNKNSP